MDIPHAASPISDRLRSFKPRIIARGNDVAGGAVSGAGNVSMTAEKIIARPRSALARAASAAGPAAAGPSASVPLPSEAPA
jgi:hypothetical protein